MHDTTAPIDFTMTLCCFGMMNARESVEALECLWNLNKGYQYNKQFATLDGLSWREAEKWNITLEYKK